MNVIARLEYELVYYDSAVHRFNHYTTRTPLSIRLNTFRLNSRIVFNILYISNDFHDMKDYFLFLSLYILRLIFTKEGIRNNIHTGFCMHHHHHLGALIAQIPLNLSHHLSLLAIALCNSSRQHPVSIQSCK